MHIISCCLNLSDNNYVCNSIGNQWFVNRTVNPIWKGSETHTRREVAPLKKYALWDTNKHVNSSVVIIRPWRRSIVVFLCSDVCCCFVDMCVCAAVSDNISASQPIETCFSLFSNEFCFFFVVILFVLWPVYSKWFGWFHSDYFRWLCNFRKLISIRDMQTVMYLGISSKSRLKHLLTFLHVISMVSGELNSRDFDRTNEWKNAWLHHVHISHITEFNSRFRSWFFLLLLFYFAHWTHVKPKREWEWDDELHFFLLPAAQYSRKRWNFLWLLGQILFASMLHIRLSGNVCIECINDTLFLWNASIRCMHTQQIRSFFYWYFIYVFCTHYIDLRNVSIIYCFTSFL